jgi:hypothetical protein
LCGEKGDIMSTATYLFASPPQIIGAAKTIKNEKVDYIEKTVKT